MLEAPGGGVTALRPLFGERLRAPDNLRRVSGAIAGADPRYDVGDDHPASGGSCRRSR